MPDEVNEVVPWSSSAVVLWDAAGLAALLEHSADIVVVLDAVGGVRFANPAGQRLLNHGAGTLLGTDAFALVHPDDRERAAEAFATILASHDRVGPTSLRLRDEAGRWRHVEVVGNNLLARPEVAGVVLNINDVTDRIAAEAALRASEARYRNLADNAPDVIFRYRVAGERGFEYVSPSAQPITGYSPEELRDHPDLVLELTTSEVRKELAGLDPEEALRGPIEFELRRADGRRIWVQLRLTAHRDQDGSVRAVDGIMRDITERKHAEEALLHRSLHDPLTGLANRSLFSDRLDHALRRADRLPSSPAVLFLDLDGFKAINDRRGHTAGDHVLREVARRLTALMRPTDTVARVGGDEFLVLCDGINDDVELAGICDRIRASVQRPIELDGPPVTVGVSIGAVRAQEHHRADDLLRQADEAMYRDKDPGERAEDRSADRSTG